MNENVIDNRTRRFQVHVGHTSIEVEGRSTVEAVEEARRLCREMPRFWDVINALDASRFQVVIS